MQQCSEVLADVFHCIPYFYTMHSEFSYTCTHCGEIHEGWPALTFQSPADYFYLSDDDKASMATLDPDFCVIAHPEQTDRFIRVTLTQRVNDHCENLEYGLWVSLSEKSFQDYSDNYHNEEHKVSYFGWLASELPDYDEWGSIPVTVYTRKGNQRPEIVPHGGTDHPFVRDYDEGITKAEAARRVTAMIGE